MSMKRWMGDLPMRLIHVPLSCLAIPGSHNSATSDLDPALGIAVDQSASVRKLGGSVCGQSVVRKWSKTQNLSIVEQLEAGIRFFDFRIAKHPRTLEYRFVHGLYGEQVSHTFGEINMFLANNPREIVILDFNHFYNMTQRDHELLIQMIQSTFMNALVPPPFSGINHVMWGTTLAALWQTPYRVISLYHDENAHATSGMWSGENIDSPWPNTSRVNDLIAFMENIYANKYRLQNDKFYNWQGVLTPQTKDIALHLGSTLEGRLATQATAEFVKWLQSGKFPSSQGLNICSADFIEKHNFVQTVVGLNHYIQDFPRTFVASA
ncbi:PI-PLC X domain-containing protein 2-like [Dreissena polymorpha]|uniref:Phosphatidylinositol-specific phospholipase C X domain-containing protein n=1 Tax=Dreissena polymorpha TaxID=45954 RepID=A0A9D4MPT6_DREPO|nr:PI-PLC X domain-containing protein 2-like [Dreissena polymorpha]KAH3880221.1 hypothetical protein DPMN_004131 [Dreissena polymorpha]